jgi:hypothetical protein
MEQDRAMDTFAAQVGERYERDGTTYEVARITPPGAAGTRVSDGPVVHLKPVREDGNIGDFTADVWTGSISYPAAAYERI